VTLRKESFSLGELVNSFVEPCLKTGPGHDINYPAALEAKQVVVVLRQFLCQLESGKLVARDNPSNYSGLLQIDQVTIGGTPRHLWKTASNIAYAHRMSCIYQELDDIALPIGVALTCKAKPCQYQVMKTLGTIVNHRLPLPVQRHLLAKPSYLILMHLNNSVEPS